VAHYDKNEKSVDRFQFPHINNSNLQRTEQEKQFLKLWNNPATTPSSDVV